VQLRCAPRDYMEHEPGRVVHGDSPGKTWELLASQWGGLAVCVAESHDAPCNARQPSPPNVWPPNCVAAKPKTAVGASASPAPCSSEDGRPGCVVCCRLKAQSAQRVAHVIPTGSDGCVRPGSRPHLDPMPIREANRGHVSFETKLHRQPRNNWKYGLQSDDRRQRITPSNCQSSVCPLFAGGRCCATVRDRTILNLNVVGQINQSVRGSALLLAIGTGKTSNNTDHEDKGKKLPSDTRCL